jgi:thiamine kinase-like enzyme
MSEELNAFEALTLVPGWDPDEFDIQELKGGLTNRTYQLSRNDTDYVLRLDASDAGFFQFDRTCELINLAAASEAGLGPQVIHADQERGILIMEFLHGRVWDDADMQSAQSLESLAGLLQKTHALPLCGNRLDVRTVSVAYQHYLEQRHGLHAFATQCVEIIAGIPVHDTLVCCHNDIVAANVVDGGNLLLIDWEYSCDNDPLFDLASAIGFHNLDASLTEVLLSAYTGGADAALRERLDEQVRVYDAIQWLWLASRHLAFPSASQARRLECLQQRIR